MSFNGSGLFAINSSGQPVVSSTLITATAFNALTADLATGLSTCLLKDGTQTVTADLPIGGFKLTGLGTGLASRTSSARTGDIQDGTATFVAAGGTADAITATYVPVITAVVDGMLLGFRASGANTVTTPSFSPNGLTARTIVKQGGQALAVGDIRAANHDCLVRYRASGTEWELLNPTASVAVAASTTVSGISELATDAETATGTDTARVPPVSAVASAVIYQGLHTIWVPAGAMTPATTNGAASGTTELATNKNMLKTLDFDTATQEFAQFDIRLPKSWNQGTVTFMPSWTAASGSGGVVFALQAVGTRDDDAMDVAFGTEQTSTDTFIAANDCHAGPTSAAITVAGTLTSPLRVNFRIKRNVADGSDTLGVDAKLIGVHVYYTTNLRNDA